MTRAEQILSAASQLPTPLVVYDPERLAEVVSSLRSDLEALGEVRLCFSVKANRCPAVLCCLANLGLGADVASSLELTRALEAGLRPLYATAPHWSLAELDRLRQAGCLPDLDGYSQLEQWARLTGPGPAGLRLSFPGWDQQPSRFGFDPDCPRLAELLRQWQLEVRQLHVHAGEIATVERAGRLLEMLEHALDRFPATELVNLGGGLTEMYRGERPAARIWALLGKGLARRRRVRLVVEPGMAIVATAGFLVTQIVEVKGGLAVLDASAWNLLGWYPWMAPRVLATQAQGARSRWSLVGCSCYEKDYFATEVELPQLAVGQRLVLSAAGGYVTSMARSLHGLEVPPEWLFENGRLRPA
ncbi:MAG: hypothetical protein AB7S38_27310 [Vulcanimicrobiota bacterium]